jgi:tRNA(Ile)-lysidine synthase
VFEVIEKTIAQQKLFNAASPVLLMVSGGSDSTALAYIMHDLHTRGLAGPLAMLHVNHKLRGEDAEKDQQFVQSLANMLDIPFFCCEVDVAALAKESGGNVEAIGRQERYIAAHEALESLCLHTATPLSEGRIVTAHTQDDRVENFYMRSIKGTGPGGFRSMLYQNGPVVRPLLDVSRATLRSYLEDRSHQECPTLRDEQGNLWREDATNAHTDRFRAYVRHNIVPAAKEQNSQLLDTLCRSMNLIADEDDFMEALTAQEMVATVEIEDNQARLLPAFGQLALPIKRRALRSVLETLLGAEGRVESAAIDAVLQAFDPNGAPIGGYVVNIQGNLAVSANKNGVLIEPMACFRARRKRA